MSDNPVDMRDGSAISAPSCPRRAAAAELRAQSGQRIAVDDFFVPEEARLEERTRAGAVRAGPWADGHRGRRSRASRAPAHRGGEAELVGALIEPDTAVLARLWSSGLLRDGELMAELIGRARQELLGTELRAMSAPTIPSHDPA